MGSAVWATVTIASGAAASSVFELGDYRIAAVIGPAAWTAADISFEVDGGNGAYAKAVDSAGALIKITGVATAVSEYMTPPEIADRICGKTAKIVSTNTASEADVNQGAARTLVVVLAPL